MTNGYVPTNQGCNAYVCNFPDLKTNALCGYPLVKVQERNLCFPLVLNSKLFRGARLTKNGIDIISYN